MTIIKRLLIVVAGGLIIILGYNLLVFEPSAQSDELPAPGENQPLAVSNQPPLDVSLEDIWHPRPLTTTDITGQQVPSTGVGFQLTGTIIEPDFSAAFILDITSQKEDLYYQDDSIRGWVLEKIEYDQAILRKGEKWILLEVKKARSAQARPDLEIKPVPSNSPESGRQFYRPRAMDRLLENTTLDTAISLANRLPAGTVKSILNKLPSDYLREKLALSELGFSSEDLGKLNPSEVIIKLAKIGQGEIPRGGQPVYFTTRVNQHDNSPVSIQKTFKSGIKKIYACFRSEGALAKLKKVVVYWKNISRGEIIYWGVQYIDPAKPYNYIWIEDKNTWDNGTYLVAIFRTANDTQCLAQDRYEIK